MTSSSSFTPTVKSEFKFDDDTVPWRKRVPFDLVGRGVAGIDEISECLDDSKVFFGLLSVAVGSGSFQREKTIFLHFNGELHPKPLQRAKANKKINVAKQLFSPYHAELTLTNKNQCTIDYVFHKLGHIFVSDTGTKGKTTYEVGAMKEEYKKRMREAKKKAAEEKARLEQSKRALQAQQENKKKAEEEAIRQREEKKRLLKEAEEAAQRKAEEEERLRLEAENERIRLEAEAERLRLEAEAEVERVRVQEERKVAEEEAAAIAAAEAAAEAAAAAAKAAKKKKRRKRRKKDDWSNDREWTGERVVKCIHQQTSPFNWGVFSAHQTDAVCIAFGHGDLNDMRDNLSPDQVCYGIMRLTFGEGRFRRSHWVMTVWSPDSMTKNVHQKVRKKRQRDRMTHISWKGYMQKIIGPFGVEVLAESLDMVTLEDFILRVRKIVCVDGSDDFMSVEAFQIALEAEKAHFQAIKDAKEAELAAQRADEEAKEQSSSSAEEEDEDEDAADDDGSGKKNRRRKRKKHKQNDNENEDNDNSNADDEKADEVNEESSAVAVNEGNDTHESNGNKFGVSVQVSEERGEHEEEQPPPSIHAKHHLSADISADGNKSPSKKRRKSSVDPTVLKAREIQSQLCFESVTLMKRPSSDLVWVLVEPRLAAKRTRN